LRRKEGKPFAYLHLYTTFFQFWIKNFTIKLPYFQHGPSLKKIKKIIVNCFFLQKLVVLLRSLWCHWTAVEKSLPKNIPRLVWRLS